MKKPRFFILRALLPVLLWPLLIGEVSAYYEREAAILEELRTAVDRYGAKDFNTVTHRLELANFYLSKKEYFKAEPLFHQSLGIMEKRWGRDSAKLLPIIENLAALDLRQRRFSFALALYNRAILIAKRHYGSRGAETQKFNDALSETRRAEREWKRYGSRSVPVVAAPQIEADSGQNERVLKRAVVTNRHKEPVKSQNLAPSQTSATTNKAASPSTSTKRTASFARYLDAEGVPREPPAEEKQGFFISMGCFSDKPFALGQVNRVMNIPLPVYMKSIRNNQLHCVFGGPFATEREAQEGAEQSRRQARVSDTSVRQYK
ncbi:MAG: tetratricopeptide repeat protein [Magnetococcales bacterium]|nr:tetratricopeptide repeat protein [Magnetococcales bacterium]